jgi:hypothetical protein
VTHDPCIALLSDFRIVLKNGAMQRLITTGEEEKSAATEMKKMDDIMLAFRSIIRAGEEISEDILNKKMSVLTC